jgi:SAM-dependent methyltransferase
MVFSAYSQYYDLLYRDKNYIDEAGYIQELLARFGIAHGSLLELGSGTGKHGCLLAQLGFSVHGIERSGEMVARATECSGFTCQQGDIRVVQMNRTYDAVLSLFHVISYQTTNTDVKAVFARAAEHLQSGGLFVFDIWYSPAVYAQQPAVRIKRMADERVEVTRIAEPVICSSENRVDVNYTIYVRDIALGSIQSLSESHPMRHFSLPEIDLLAEASGFTRVNAEEFLTGEPTSDGTWGVCVTLKRI